MRSLVALKILLHDKATTAGSLIGVIAIVFLVGQQLTVLFGLFSYMSVLVDHSGADLWICSENTSNVNAAELIPVRYLDRVNALPEVAWAEPLVYGNADFKTKRGTSESVQIVGVRLPRGAVGPWRFYRGSGNALLEYDGVTLERLDMKMYGGAEVGDVYEMNDTRIKVGAVTQSIKGFSGRLVFTNFVKAKEILRTPPGRCKALLVKLAPGVDPESAVPVIRHVLPHTEVFSTAELSRKTRLYYVVNTGMGGSFGFSTMVGALVGIIIITLTMYTGVLQRQKDFAVLRALGARKIDIFLVVLSQSLMLAVTGIFIGFLLLALFLNATQDSSLPTYLPRQVPALLGAGTLLLCMGGSLLAMRKAVSVDPASVFR